MLVFALLCEGGDNPVSIDQPPLVFYSLLDDEGEMLTSMLVAETMLSSSGLRAFFGGMTGEEIYVSMEGRRCENG